MLSEIDSQFRKVLLLSAASHFEVQVRDTLVDYFTEKANGDVPSIAFLRAKAIERQYHTYFKWDGNNANQFFGLFGSGFKEFMGRRLQVNPRLGEGMRAFLELGDLRNNLVHRDFATFALDKTIEEIYALYDTARPFVQSLGSALREYANECTTGEGAPAA